MHSAGEGTGWLIEAGGMFREAGEREREREAGVFSFAYRLLYQCDTLPRQFMHCG
jgi:hypothetical protein